MISSRVLVTTSIDQHRFLVFGNNVGGRRIEYQQHLGEKTDILNPGNLEVQSRLGNRFLIFLELQDNGVLGHIDCKGGSIKRQHQSH
jgi:hypothetical protein